MRRDARIAVTELQAKYSTVLVISRWLYRIFEARGHDMRNFVINQPVKKGDK